MSHIIPLDTVPPAAIETLLDAAFGPDRHGRTAYRIREGMAWLPGLSVAMAGDDGALIGSLQSWPVALTGAGGGQTPLIMIGPVAVAPAHQKDGHGRAMMDAVIATARARATNFDASHAVSPKSSWVAACTCTIVSRFDGFAPTSRPTNWST